MLRFLTNKAVRTALMWQLAVTVTLAVAAWPWFGVNGALSAVLGGVVNLLAGIVFFALAGLGLEPSAFGTIRQVFRAEAGKIIVIIGALWASIALYTGLVAVLFFSVFAITALMPSVALLVRDEPARSLGPAAKP